MSRSLKLVKKNKDSFIGFRIDSDIKDKLEIIADSQGRSLSNFFETVCYNIVRQNEIDSDSTISTT